jgi:hypothetical protein
MTYFKLVTGTGNIYRSFDADTFIVIELFNGEFQKRMVRYQKEALYNHLQSNSTEQNFVETNEEEFILNKTEILAVLNNA